MKTYKEWLKYYSNATREEILEDTYKDYAAVNKKYDKILSILSNNYLPCEIDDFMDEHTDYCSRNCSVDEEVFKKCWDKFIEWKLERDE